MRRIEKLLALAALSCAVGIPAEGQAPANPDMAEMELSDLIRVKVENVYSASKRSQPAIHAPASVTQISAEEIKRFGYRTLGDLLRTVPGFYVTYDRNYTYLSSRGFGRTGDYNSRILLLVDGHRMNDSIFGQALLGTEFPVDLELIRHVEIVRGPSSAVHGNNAFFAVVNIITRKDSFGNGLQAGLEGGSFLTGSARLTAGWTPGNGMRSLVSATQYSSRGPKSLSFPEFASPENPEGRVVESDHDRSKQMFASLGYRGWELVAAYGSRDKQIPTASFGTVFGDSRFRITDRRGYVDLEHRRTLKGSWEMSARAYLDSYIYDGDYPLQAVPPAQAQSPLNRDYTNSASWGEEVNFSRTAGRHNLIVGQAYLDNFRRQQSNFFLEPFSLEFDDQHASQVWALFAQDEYAFTPRLLANVGVRYDHDSGYGSTASPRAALIFHPQPQTTLKGIFGTAYRAPNAFEIYNAVEELGQRANPSLEPENIRAFEIVAESYFGERFRLSGSVFRNTITGLIQQTELPDSTLQFQNSGAVNTHGVEAGFDSRWPSGLGVQVNYSYQRATDGGTGTALRDAPRHLAGANLLIPIVRTDLTAGLTIQYVSARLDRQGATAPGFALANLTLFSHRLAHGLELSGSIYNLFDRRYSYPAGEEFRQSVIEQDGRTARLKMSIRFGE